MKSAKVVFCLLAMSVLGGPAKVCATEQTRWLELSTMSCG
jgi:hypothetical protein